MNGAYSIRFTSRAARDVDGLPEKIATACVAFIFGALAENPQRVGKPLRAELAGLHSARRGDYRVIYGILDDTHTVEILHVQRRSDVYRLRAKLIEDASRPTVDEVLARAGGRAGGSVSLTSAADILRGERVRR